MRSLANKRLNHTSKTITRCDWLKLTEVARLAFGSGQLGFERFYHHLGAPSSPLDLIVGPLWIGPGRRWVFCSARMVQEKPLLQGPSQTGLVQKFFQVI